MPGKQKGHGHTSYKKFYVVQCPTCGARVGRHCHSKGKDNWTKVHDKRRRALRPPARRVDPLAQKLMEVYSGATISVSETSAARQGRSVQTSS